MRSEGLRVAGQPSNARHRRVRTFLQSLALHAVAAPLLLLLGACAGLPPGTQTPADANRMERQILLTVEQTDFSALALTGEPSRRYLRRRGYGAAPPAIDRLLNQLAREYGIARKEGWPIRSLDVYCEVFEVPEGVELEVVLDRLRGDSRVDLAQPMNVFETLSSRYDDPYVDLQPAADELDVEQAHRLATGKGVLIAVIDTAVDSRHPELRGRISVNRDLVGLRRKAGAAEVHGTAVAGVIASATNNQEGIVGIAPDARIAALRACWPMSASSSGARCSSFTLAQALETAIDLGPALVNLSLTGPPDPLLSRLLDRAIERGIVVVAAEPASLDRAAFPASHPGVIVARTSFGARKEWSPYRLPAPAHEVLTTTPGAGYAFFSGTSFAAAHLSGVIALLIELEPQISIRRIADVLAQTAVYTDDNASINACFALEELMGVHACEPRIETAAF